MMMKDSISLKLISLLIGITALGLLAAIIVSEKSGTNKQYRVLQDFSVITVSKDGYSPPELTISLGTTVIWKNNDTRLHWPASNFHPTHTLYPETGEDDCLGSSFDACRGLTQGETYTFTFEYSGSWAYHDHLFPSVGGVVYVESGNTQIVQADTKKTVREERGFFKKIIKGIRTIVNSITLRVSSLFDYEEDKIRATLPYPQHFRSLPYQKQTEIIEQVSNDNPSEGWEYLKQVFVVNGQVVGNAHELSHIVGNTLYQQKGIEGIEICDPTFAYGCYHGVTEQFLITEGVSSVREAMEQCRKIFPVTQSSNYLPYYSCVHGLGHGLLSWEGLDLGKALKDCDRLDVREQQYCYDGVFMEHSFSAPFASFDKAEPWKLCTDLDEKYHMNCARYQPARFAEKFHVDLPTSARMCLEAETETLRGFCIDAVGFALAYTFRDTVDTIKHTCGSIPLETYRYRCITAAAGELVFQRYQEWEESSFKLCDTLPEPWQGQCFMLNQGIKGNNVRISI